MKFNSRLFLAAVLVLSAMELINCYERKFTETLPKMLSNNINITTYSGETVKLPCELSNLGSYHVNWLKIRNNYPQALTVGYQQFSRNMRYRVSRVHDAETNIESWDFEIRRVTHEDEGKYECYVKLSPRHKLRAHVYLTVRERRAYTTDPRSQRLSSSNIEKIHIPPNNWIKLRCNASNTLFQTSSEQSNSDLQWFKDGEVIEQDSRRLKKWVASYDNSNYMELDLFAVDPKTDSGNYQCKRDNVILKNVFLQVNNAINLKSVNHVLVLLVSFVLPAIIFL